MTAAGVFESSFGLLPALKLRAPSGASALLTPFGAQLVSWRGADGAERLFCSARSAQDGTRAIRGGVPVIFPQFGARGPGLRHGFARLSHWRLGASRVDAESVALTLHLTPADVSAAHAGGWPHAFELALTVTLGPDTLTLALEVHNPGPQAFTWACALHSYFAIDALGAAHIEGLQHCRYADHSGNVSSLETATKLTPEGRMDRIYRSVAGPLELTDRHHALRLTQHGFDEAVVWNPGADDARALDDLGDEEWRKFLCVEAARTALGVMAPGGRWHGMQRWQIVR